MAEEMEKPWWWKLPDWMPGVEAARLTHQEARNILDRLDINARLRKVDKVLHSNEYEDRDEAQQLNLASDRVQLEHWRTAFLDEERTLTMRRQNLLLKRSVLATWAAALAALVPVLWELARPAVRRWLGL